MLILQPERALNLNRPLKHRVIQKTLRRRIFKLSWDEQFEAKFRKVIGVYLDPHRAGSRFRQGRRPVTGSRPFRVNETTN